MTDREKMKREAVKFDEDAAFIASLPPIDGVPATSSSAETARLLRVGVKALDDNDALEKKVIAMMKWLEANQPDVFCRGFWDAVP